MNLARENDMRNAGLLVVRRYSKDHEFQLEAHRIERPGPLSLDIRFAWPGCILAGIVIAPAQCCAAQIRHKGKRQQDDLSRVTNNQHALA
jgi:hypothetical protein